MSQFALLSLNEGSFAEGFSATLQIDAKNDKGNYSLTVRGKLPPNQTISQTYQAWHRVFGTKEYKDKSSFLEKSELLRDRLNLWLNAEPFAPIKQKLEEILTSSTDDEVQLLVQAEDYQLWRLPWEQWDFLADRPQVKVALSSPASKSIKRCALAKPKTKIRILYIEGNTKNIKTDGDIQNLRTLFQGKADIELRKQPSRKELSRCLRDENGWDIIFFAGHSRTDVQQTGRIDINEQESLTIPELKYALRTAIALGLKLAIFNSCDGLGLARNLADLQIPSVVVMREPVPDKAAQVFVKEFLEIFAKNESLYASVREARESLKARENEYPCASWLPVICQNSGDEPITCDGLLQGLNTETNWEGCCRTLLALDALKRLNSNMLTQKKGLDIDDIYVPLNLGLVKRFKDKDSGQLSDQEKAQQKLEEQFPDTYKQEDFLVKVLQRGRSPYSQGRRIAIIGEAGTGKSLFLQRLGEWILWESDITNQLVIWVSLADLRKGQNLGDYLQENWLENAKTQVNIPGTIKEDLVNLFISSGRVLLLLDGADEMPVSSGNPLAEITRQIAESEWISQARIVLTCRVNVWEANQAILQNFDVYRNLEFSYQAKYGRTIDQVEAFIDGWFAGNDEQKKTGKALRQALEQEGKQQIKDLAKNPLRLSLLCGVWEERWKLPETRETLPNTKAELYKEFVEDIYKWKQDTLPVDESKRESLNKNLAELAKRSLDLRRQNFVKSLLIKLQEESQTLVSKSLLADMPLAGLELQESPFRIPHNLAWSILASDLDLALNLGWINLVGVSKNNPLERIYAFFHPIFHEYFAAQAIEFNEWNYFLAHDNTFTSHPAYGTYRVFEQQWREVILLWFGRPSDEVPNWCKESFLQTLWQFEDLCKGFYSFQAKFLAAAALGEFKNCNTQLAGQIINETIDSSFTYKINESKYSFPFNADKRRSYTALLQTDGSKAKEPLVNLLNEIPKDHIGTRSDIADALAQLDPGNQEAIKTYLDLTQIDEDSIDSIKIKFYAKEKLAEIAHGNAEAITRLNRLVDKEQDEDKRKMATVALGIIASGNIPNKPNMDVFNIAKKAIKALIEILFTSSDRHQALVLHEYFENIALENFDIKVSEQVVENLTYLLETRKYKNLPWLASKPELKLPWYEQSDRAHCKSYAFTRYQQIRLCAAQGLFKINPNNQEAVNTLVELMQIDRDHPLINYQDANLISEVAAEILEKFGVDNRIVISALSACIANTENDTALRIAANTLGKLAAGTNDEGAIEALITRIHKTEDLWRREQLAEILGKIQPDHPEAVRVLNELINSSLTNNDLVDFLIAEAAKDLGIIAPNNIDAIETLIDLQQSAQNKLNYFINELGIGYENADDSIHEMLKESYNIYGDDSARTNFLREASKTHGLLTTSIKNLGGLTYSNAKVINTLTNLLDYPEEKVRYEAAMSLLKIDPGNPSAINTLITLHRHGQKEFYQDRARGVFQSFAKQVTEISDRQRRENLINAVIEIMQTHPNIHQRYHTAKALAQADPGNVQVVATLLDLLQNHSDIHRYDVIRVLKQTLRGQQFSQIVRDLNDILDDTYKNNYELFEVYYELFWHCAENISYPEFLKALYRQPDFFYLKPKLLKGRLVYLLLLGFDTCQDYLSSYLKHPHYILLDIISLIQLIFRYVYKIFIALGIPLFIVILFILAIFNKKLRSDFIYVLKLFYISIAGIFYNSLPQIFRLIQIRRRKQQ